MEQRLCRSVTRDPDGSSLAVPAFSCSTGTEGGGPDVPELGEGGRTPPCPSFGCCTSYLLFRHRSTIPCNSTRLLGGNPAWDCVSIAWGSDRAAVPWLPGSSGAAGSNQALWWVGKGWHQQAISPVPWGKGDPGLCERGAGKGGISSQAS